MMSDLVRAPCPVRILGAGGTEIELRVHWARGVGPHPAIALADGSARLAAHFSDDGFTAIEFTHRHGDDAPVHLDDYRPLLEWMTSQRDIDATCIFAWCRNLDELHAWNTTTVGPRLRGGIVEVAADRRGAQGSWRGRHAVGRHTSAISYPVLVIVDGAGYDERVVRRIAKHVHRIEVFVATSRARALDAEADFLRFHAGLPVTTYEAG